MLSSSPPSLQDKRDLHADGWKALSRIASVTERLKEAVIVACIITSVDEKEPSQNAVFPIKIS
jgi:hypothetical protein